jgi:hypothetical protein
MAGLFPEASSASSSLPEIAASLSVLLVERILFASLMRRPYNIGYLCLARRGFTLFFCDKGFLEPHPLGAN